MLNITLQKQHSKWEIFIDGAPWKMLHTSIVGHKLKLPAFESIEEAESFLANLEKRGALNFALRRLTTRNHSSAELRAKLKEKWVTEKILYQVISHCQKLGYLDDTQFVETSVRSLINKGKGPRVILYKLQNKGIPIEEARQALAKFQHPDNQQEAISSHLKKRFKNLDFNEPKNQKKVIAAFVRKGFDLHEVIKAIQAHK